MTGRIVSGVFTITAPLPPTYSSVLQINDRNEIASSSSPQLTCKSPNITPTIPPLISATSVANSQQNEFKYKPVDPRLKYKYI